MRKLALPVLYLGHGGGVWIGIICQLLLMIMCAELGFVFYFSWHRWYRQKPLPVASVPKISESGLVWIITSEMPRAVVMTVVLPLLIGCRVGIFIFSLKIMIEVH